MESMRQSRPTSFAYLYDSVGDEKLLLENIQSPASVEMLSTMRHVGKNSGNILTS